MNVPDAADWSLGRLLSTAARMIEHDWNAWLATHDLTHAGLLALHALEDGPLTQRKLAAASRVEEQTMSRVVARLERAGYVEPGARPFRSPPPGDRSYVARLGGFCQSPGRGSFRSTRRTLDR